MIKGEKQADQRNFTASATTPMFWKAKIQEVKVIIKRIVFVFFRSKVSLHVFEGPCMPFPRIYGGNTADGQARNYSLQKILPGVWGGACAAPSSAGCAHEFDVEVAADFLKRTHAAILSWRIFSTLASRSVSVFKTSSSFSFSMTCEAASGRQ